jgi:hypothetical protein
VLDKATHERQRSEPADALVSGAEDDLVVVDVEQAAVRDRNPVGLQTEVTD